jgi:hypothetical protein
MALGLKKSPDKIIGAFRLFGFFFGEFRIREFLVEFVNPPRCIDKLHFAGEKRMGLTRDLEFHQGIFLSILPFDGVLGRRAGLSQEGEVTGKILKHNVPVIGRMDIFFHGFFRMDGKGTTIEDTIQADRVNFALKISQ